MNPNPLNSLRQLPEVSEQVIHQLFAVFNHHEDTVQMVPPTACFKANSLLNFVIAFELFSMLLPKHIKISMV